ncbi:cyanase [Zhaonella formicivorans]|uniref:cyanase n=1 Tax=Zhaonella formicivorans TaxID=2528593 RepID=UPI0010D315A6|nr:cyanase [Zhaonella formicivorans]
MNRLEALEILQEARKKQGLTYEQLGVKVGHNAMWIASAFQGQQHVPPEEAIKIVQELGVPKDVAEVLAQHPYKGKTDPVIYRLQEIVDVYGPAIKEVIHEKFGNGIMSAIDFTIDIQKQEDPKGDRVLITMSGKFLPYKIF